MTEYPCLPVRWNFKVHRTFANAFLSLVVMASCLWGGCVSCEQYFMFAKDDCCHHGKCGTSQQKSAPEDCAILPVLHERTPGAPSDAAIFAAVPVFVVDAARPYTPPRCLNVFFDPVDVSPPDLPVLNASLLI